MKRAYKVKKKHCIEFESFAEELWISDKHNEYWYDLAKFDNWICVWEDMYSVTMVDYYLDTFKEWNWEILDNFNKQLWNQ